MTANQVPSVMREGVPSVISVPFVPSVPWAYLNTATTCCGGGGVRPSPGAATPTGGSASKQLCAHGGPEPAAPGDGRTPVAVSRCAPVSSTSRFTLDGSAELENLLASICRRVRAGVQSLVPGKKIEAIMLGGGYGRGEGGVLKTSVGDRPYNDLEFYVCVQGSQWLNQRRYGKGLEMLGEELSADAEIEVELKLFSLAKLERARVSMFYYDLVAGHRWVWGTESLLAGCSHHLQADRIPLCEATRLLMNRCSGLLFAKERLQRGDLGAEDADFVRRNLAKAQLTFGDALLTARRQYHWSCRQRHERLERFLPGEDLPSLPEVLRHHAVGVNFKLHPWRAKATPVALQSLHQDLTALGLQLWLWLESHRLDNTFTSPRHYALSPVNKCPETDLWRNCLVNLETAGPRVLFSPRAALNPRMRLLHALSLLLFEPDSMRDAPLLNRLQSELATDATTFRGLTTAYKSLWRQFN